MNKTEWYDIITQGTDDVLCVDSFVSPVDFCSILNFSKDFTARQTDIDLNLTPYMRDIIRHWDTKGKGQKEVTIMAPEQCGKSLSWQIGLIWSFLYNPCLSMVVYPSSDKANEVNRNKLQPLMLSIPALAAELELPRTKAADRYNLSTAVSMFQGSGERISAHSARIRVADELDDWIDSEGHASKVDDLRKRGRTFDDALFIKVSSPKGEKSKIFAEFLQSSMGYWHLRCQDCSQLSMRSCDIHNLKFDFTLNKKTKLLTKGTERLVCPICKFEHTEDMKRVMNLQGGYIHKRPDIKEHLGYQWGALASQWSSLSWTIIAEAQLKSGVTGKWQDQVAFDNSFRGLPHTRRKMHKGEGDSILKHCVADKVKPEELSAVFLSADTQDFGWVWELRGLGITGDRYQLAYGVCEHLELTPEERERHEAKGRHEAKLLEQEYIPVPTLDEVIQGGWGGMPVVMALIDEGGTRKPELMTYVNKHKRVFTYKGGLRAVDKNWEWSKNQKKLILAKRDPFQAELLYYLHFQDPEAQQQWHLLPKDMITDNYITEVCAIQKAVNVKGELLKDGDQLENWTHAGRRHDWFDVGLIYLVLEQVALECVKAKEYRGGIHPKAKATEVKAAEAKVEPQAPKLKLDIGADTKAPFVMAWKR